MELSGQYHVPDTVEKRKNPCPFQEPKPVVIPTELSRLFILASQRFKCRLSEITGRTRMTVTKWIPYEYLRPEDDT
jgi:hypothetical protein